MPSLDIPSSPSDDGSLVFDSSSEGVHTPNERVSPVISGAKGVTAVGVAVHSPPALFIGTPFTTGANTLFEYPFPPTRPVLSATSSISSVASSILGPPSPSTRAKYIPRTTKSQTTSRRRLSGNSPLAVRVPPRLRTDSSGSVASTSESGTSKPLSRQVSLRDRSGSLGVLPIQLPPPSIATMGLGPPVAGPLSPAALVGAMASTGFGMAYTTEPDEEQGVANGKRRASMPALFTPELGREEEGRLDEGDIDDHP